MRTSTLLFSTFIAATSLVATTAHADEVVVQQGEPVWVHGRDGIVLGASIDGGDMGCQTKNGDDCGNGQKAAGGFSGHLGGMLTPNLALLGEVWAMGHTEDNITATQVIATAALRGWVTRRLWLQGGLGFARSKISYSGGDFMAGEESATVPAFMAAIGVEVVHTHTFGLDIEARTGTGFYEGDARIYNGALGVGLSWF
jgi:hypothetical protein